MLEELVAGEICSSDLNMYHCGREDCMPGHSYGPAVRDHYLIHYIVQGKGIFQFGDQMYTLGENQGFLIFPEDITFYKADDRQPWRYLWVGFHGTKAEQYLHAAGLTRQQPVFQYDRDDALCSCIQSMIACQTLQKGRELRLTGLLYSFLACLVENGSNQHTVEEGMGRGEFYVQKAVEYINMNYSRQVSIQELAAYVSIDRSYLCALFKQVLGISPQQYLIHYRMDKACVLMKNSILSIGDVARSVGYEDPLLFSRMFKSVKGQCPRSYRTIRISAKSE